MKAALGPTSAAPSKARRRRPARSSERIMEPPIRESYFVSQSIGLLSLKIKPVVPAPEARFGRRPRGARPCGWRACAPPVPGRRSRSTLVSSRSPAAPKPPMRWPLPRPISLSPPHSPRRFSPPRSRRRSSSGARRSAADASAPVARCEGSSAPWSASWPAAPRPPTCVVPLGRPGKESSGPPSKRLRCGSLAASASGSPWHSGATPIRPPSASRCGTIPRGVVCSRRGGCRSCRPSNRGGRCAAPWREARRRSPWRRLNPWPAVATARPSAGSSAIRTLSPVDLMPRGWRCCVRSGPMPRRSSRMRSNGGSTTSASSAPSSRCWGSAAIVRRVSCWSGGWRPRTSTCG